MKYYQKLTLLLALSWGFIAIQRIVIAVIMPAIQADMKFNYTDVGMVMSITGLFYAICSIIWGFIGDKYGRRLVIVVCGFLAAVFSWITGMVYTLTSMLTVRGILGFFEAGPWAPTNATIGEEAPAEKRGMLIGFLPGSFFLIGVCLGPSLAVALLAKLGAWRPVFYFISLPGLILSILCAFVMHEPASTTAVIKARKLGHKQDVMQDGCKVKLSDVLKYKNVLTSTINAIPANAAMWISFSFSSLFLAKVHGFGIEQVGLTMSAFGLGGFIGTSGMGRISDTMGRKPAIILTGFICCLVGLGIIAMPIGTPAATFAALYLFWGMSGGASIPLLLGIIPSDTVPHEFAGTAVGIPTCVGEIVGAAVIPGIAGVLADAFGLYAPMWMAAISALAITLISFVYVETAPKRVARMQNKPTHEDHLLKPFRGKSTAA